MDTSGATANSDEEFMSQFFFDDFDNLVESAVVQLVKEDGLRRRRKKWGGSKKGKRANKNRNILEGGRRIWADYFAENDVYDATDFRRRFRMSKRLCQCIIENVAGHEVYFTQRPDATGKLGATPYQNVTAVLKVLIYGTTSDAFDDYVRLSDSTVDKAVNLFARTVNEVFGSEYLRSPTIADVQYLMNMNARRGMPGMLGSLDCTHWGWEQCPTALKGQYQDRDGKVTTILEAIASPDGWIWHAFFGMPDSCNDINVIDNSPFLFKMMEGGFGASEYAVNGKPFVLPYFLVDGIYPSWDH